MGLFDSFSKKAEEKSEGKPASAPRGKYDESCAMCGRGGTERKWMGQYWHKKCMRAAKRVAKGMI